MESIRDLVADEASGEVMETRMGGFGRLLEPIHDAVHHQNTPENEGDAQEPREHFPLGRQYDRHPTPVDEVAPLTHAFARPSEPAVTPPPRHRLSSRTSSFRPLQSSTRATRTTPRYLPGRLERRLHPIRHSERGGMNDFDD